MNFLRRNRFVLLFLGLVVFCSVMVVRQTAVNDARHIEVREAFLLLHSSGNDKPAQKLYEWLIRHLDSVPLSALLEDKDRLAGLVDATKEQHDNLVWRYNRSVANELAKRAQSNLPRALKLAEDLP